MFSRLIIPFLLVPLLLLGACRPSPPEGTPGSIIATTASADGVAIRHESTAKADVALVFIHCWSCHRGFWETQMEFFAPRYQVVRMDLAGHGDSGRIREMYSIAAFGADVAAVVRGLGLERVILIGHSMGGPVALEAEKLLGDVVIGVVGVDSFYTGFDLPKDKKAARAAIDKAMRAFEENFEEASMGMMRTLFGPDADPALVDAIARNAAAADRKIATSALRETFLWYAHASRAALQRVKPKLRNINADPKAQGKPLDASVVLIARAGHFIPQEKPHEFDRALDAIVAQFVERADKRREGR
jgi:pimeloyl-ACP methyl ester carboxylesterase